jgi:type VI secretion system secreted protein Hcp
MILVHIEGIKGDSKVEGYAGKDWFSVDSFSFGVERDTKESAKVGTDDLTIGVGMLSACEFNKSTDVGTSTLMNYSISGGPLPFAEIHFVQTKEGGAVYPYLMLKLEPCFIKTWKISGGEDGRPTEDVSLWYQRIAMDYRTYSRGDTGQYQYSASNTFGWDQTINAPWTVKLTNPAGS